MRDFMSRLGAPELIAFARHFCVGEVYGGFRSSPIVRLFRDFENRQKLSLPDAIPDINVDSLYVTRDLRHEIDFLERLELSCERQAIGEVLCGDFGNSDRRQIRSFGGPKAFGP